MINSMSVLQSWNLIIQSKRLLKLHYNISENMKSIYMFLHKSFKYQTILLNVKMHTIGLNLKKLTQTVKSLLSLFVFNSKTRANT